MKILIYIPHTRRYPAALSAIHAIDTTGHEVAWVFDGTGDHFPDRWDNVTAKYRHARMLALTGGYDALFCVEDDIIPPPDALHKLIAVGSDVAYGLTVCRDSTRSWSACNMVGPADGDYYPVTQHGVMGSVIDVVGCGLMCTLIRADVLARVPFERRGSRCCDFYFAYDVWAAKYSQRCDTSIVCAHILDDTHAMIPTAEGHTVIDL